MGRDGAGSPVPGATARRTPWGFDAVETRKVDALDFRDCAVWTVRDAIEAAFLAGFDAGKRER